MGKALVPIGRRPTTEFHPGVLRVVLALAAVFIAGAWGFLAGSGYVSLVAGIVTFFTLVVLAIPFDLWRIKAEHDSSAQLPRGSFHDWLNTDMDVWQDRMSGREAMITALLPIAAVAIGALLFAIAFQIATAVK
jgi:hypothetical protein